MSGPRDASLNGDGFRFYRWIDPVTKAETDVLSVTSIRNLCGTSWQLSRWQLANLADAALGTMKRTVIGPRGGIKEVRQVWEYPNEFALRYDATKGEQGEIDTLRKWLIEQAEEPRNIAAVRGSIVHGAIEKNVGWDRIERPYVESAFASLSQRDRAKVKRAINDEDISFVRNGVRHYWDMRATLPMLILAREVQVFNLTAGYAGSFDALAWLFGEFGEDDEFTPFSDEKMAVVRAIRADKVSLATISEHGGTLVLLDWKTSKDVHTDQVVQAHAYLAAEFVGRSVGDIGVVDKRLTDLLNAAHYGGLVHIRPNGWAMHCFPYEDEVVRAFLGSVAFARFLAKYPKPDRIFTHTFRGASEETDEEVAA